MPVEPTVTLPGLARAYSARSFRFLNGESACTAKLHGSSITLPRSSKRCGPPNCAGRSIGMVMSGGVLTKPMV